jgi:hypothetical protein
MQLTIIVPDSVVGVDKKFFDGFDMTQVPSEVRALQWADTQGQLEFFDYRSNETLVALPVWAEALYQQWLVVEERNKPPEPSALMENKAKAAIYLSASDWAVLPDIANPATANPYLANQAEFAAYRSQLRAMYVSPTDGPVVFPETPKAVWQTTQ